MSTLTIAFSDPVYPNLVLKDPQFHEYKSIPTTSQVVLMVQTAEGESLTWPIERIHGTRLVEGDES